MVSVWHLVQTANWPAAVAHLVAVLCAVRIMAIAALNQPDIHAMAIRPRELRLLRGVASVAQLGLRLHQHEIHVGGLVRAVAGGATDAAGQVLRLGEVLRLQAGLVTLGADRRSLCRAQRLEANDLGDVAAAVNVRLGGTVAGLASVLVALKQRRMRSAGEVLVPDLLVAGLADVILRILPSGRKGQHSGGLRGRLARRCLPRLALPR